MSHIKTIKNDIQESYCSLEVSKLLKKKGCDLPAQLVHYHPPRKKDGVYLGPGFARTYKFYANDPKDGSERIHSYAHALAIEWIRVNFGIWIRINVGVISTFTYTIENIQLKPLHWNNQFKSPQEATEAALLYTLKNLI